MARKGIEAQARSIVKKLQDAGYIALYAGGWVRDYLLHRTSDDIDIATSAHPEEVRKLFPRSVAVGLQFGVVRVRVDHHEFEVASFRSDDQYIDGRRPSSVSLHSSPEKDANRRDFTINGMFFDPVQNQVYDYVGGQKDLKNNILSAIGNPLHRFQEDRLRIVRAVRFKNTFSMSVEKNTWQAMRTECSAVTKSVSPERLWQELDKMLSKGILPACLRDMREIGLLSFLFPHLQGPSDAYFEQGLEALSRYKGTSLAAALCHIIPLNVRKTIATTFRLSGREQAIMNAFSQLESHFSTRAHDDLLAKLFALPEINEALLSFAARKKQPKQFLDRIHEKKKKLRFWTSQIQTRKYLVGGDDLKKLGIPPGKRFGELIEKAFSLSCRLHIRKKEKLLLLLQKEGKSL